MNHFNVLIYSKFSKSSQTFITLLKQANLDIEINFLSIDNSTMRKRVLSSKQLDIKFVPCLLLVSPKRIDKYEGEDSFKWLRFLIQERNLKKAQETAIHQPILPPPPQTTEPPETNHEPKPQPPPPPSQSTLNNDDITSFTSFNEINQEELVTRIGDDDDDAFQVEIQEQPLKRTNLSLEEQIGSRFLNDDMEDIIPKPQKPAVKENKKKNDLLSSALQMQKLRESDEMFIGKNPQLGLR